MSRVGVKAADLRAVPVGGTFVGYDPASAEDDWATEVVMRKIAEDRVEVVSTHRYRTEIDLKKSEWRMG